jgi:hypothetical protein
MKLLFAAALVLIPPLLATVVNNVQAGTERITNQETIQVDVVLKTKKGWTYRKAPVHPFGDGRIVICEEFKDKTTAMCIALIDDGDVVLAATQLLEQKT